LNPAAPSCPICHSRSSNLYAECEDVEYFTDLGKFRFYQCTDCEILHISPMLAERLSDIYPSNYYSFTETSSNPVQQIKQWLDRRNFRRICAPIPGDKLAVLDVGGGTGWVLSQVKEAENRVNETWIADIDPQALSAAQLAGHHFVLGPFERFRSDRQFDLILLLNFIEHVPDPVAALRHAASMLAQHGRVLVKTPNFDALDARLFRHHSWGGFHTPRHFVLFTERSIRDISRRAGLHISELRYTQGAPFWAVSILNWLREWGFVSLSRDRPSMRHPFTPTLHALFAAFDFARMPLSKLSQMELVLCKE